MLIDFEVENFLSYRDPMKLSFVASPIKEHPENVVQLEDLGLSVLRSAAVYGANASGKSNLLSAMDALSDLLASPMERITAKRIGESRFALDWLSATKPTKFRVRFLISGNLYDYALSLRVGQVEEERLTVHPHGRPQEWFVRRGDSIDFKSPHLKGQKQSLRGLTPASVPLLAVAAAFGHPQLHPPALWIKTNLEDRFGTLEVMRGPAHSNLIRDTARRCHENISFRLWVDTFLSHADLGIEGLEIEAVDLLSEKDLRQSDPNDTSSALFDGIAEKHYQPRFVHSGKEGVKARLTINSQSRGTRRLFGMLSPLYDVFNAGQLAIFDELGSSLHPSLVRELIRAFHNPTLNRSGAQLLFTTHDISLLSRQLFRRDQIWFTEKDRSGATDLYSLHDIKGVREDESFEKGYIRGRYGAIPFFGSLDFPPVTQAVAEAVESKT
jgi:uncharacterized protein